MRKTRKTRKQNGGNIDEAKRRIDAWKTGPLNLTGLGLTSLPALPDDLLILICADNKLTRLPSELPTKLKILNCGYNQLRRLSELPSELEELQCGNNPLTRLLVSNDSELPNTLLKLECTSNNLTLLPELPDKLEVLICYNNKLTRLPEPPVTLDALHCGNNLLTDLPELPDGLQVLTCDYNQLTELPPLPGVLSLLDCEHNNLPTEYYKLPGEESRRSQIDYVERVRIITNRAPEEPINFSKTLEVSKNAENIYLQPIKNGEKLANIPRSVNEYNSKFGSYMTYNTYKQYPITKNPSSRYNFNKKNVKYYTAKLKKNATTN